MPEREDEAQSCLECRQILEALKSLADPEKTVGMSSYVMNTKKALGVSMPLLRQTAKKTREKPLPRS